MQSAYLFNQYPERELWAVHAHFCFGRRAVAAATDGDNQRVSRRLRLASIIVGALAGAVAWWPLVEIYPVGLVLGGVAVGAAWYIAVRLARTNARSALKAATIAGGVAVASAFATVLFLIWFFGAPD